MLISEISDGKHLRRWGTELLDAESIQAQAMVSDDQPWSANMGPTWSNFFMGGHQLSSDSDVS